MADWWTNDPVVGSSPQRIGYIPGTPKAKDPMQAEKDQLDIEGKRLSNQKAQRDLEKGGTGADKPTSAEQQGLSFFQRATAANQQYEVTGMGPRSVASAAIHDIAPSIQKSYLPEMLGGDSVKRQVADANQLAFVNAILRSDSGANAPEQEVDRYVQQFFPQPGETDPAVIEAKRQLRLQAIEGLRAKAGTLAPADMPQTAPDRTPQGEVIHPDMSSGMSVAQGTHTADDPALAGVNAKLNQLVKSGADAKTIAAYMQSVGINPAETSLLKVLAFRKSNPGYKGDYFVNVDDQVVPNSGFQNFAASPVGAAGIAMGDTVSGGHLDNFAGLMGGNADLANIGISQSRQNHPYASMAGDVAGGATLALGANAAGLLPAGEGALGALAPQALASDAALGAYVSSGQGGTQIADPCNMILGAITGAGTGAAVRGGLNATGAAISPTGGALAPLYERGVRPTVGQRMGASDSFLGKMGNRAEQAMGSVPGFGSIQRGARNAAVGEMQTGAFNDALGEIGIRLPKGITKGKQAHAFMQRAFTQAYDRALSGMRFVPDDGLAAAIDDIAPDAGLLTPASQGILKKISDDIGSKLAASGGELSGDQYKLVVSRLNAKIGSLRSSPSGDHELASVLERTKQAIEDAARRSSDPEAVAALDAVDRGYAKAVIIENAGKARGGEAGEFNGTQLDAAVQKSDKSRRSRAYLRGEAAMQDYAAAAKKLGDELPDSGTGERLATMGALGGAAHFISPGALLPWIADTAANLPGVRQTLGALMAPRPNSIRPMTDQLRHSLEMIARYGGPITVPTTTTR